jgi:ribosomal protein S27E
MMKSNLVIVKCSKCGRFTHIFGKTEDDKKICAVCVLGQFMDETKPQVGPSEVKDVSSGNN